jgi:hypothetical protein
MFWGGQISTLTPGQIWMLIDITMELDGIQWGFDDVQ